jgi:hypothetical protein
MEETHLCPGQKKSMAETRGSYTLFPFEAELAYQGNTPYLPSFSSGKNFIFMKRSL